jgi:hypothetical protein
MSQNKSNINKEYDIMYYDTGDFDERLFIDQRDQIGTPSKVPSQTRNYYHLKGKSQGNGIEVSGLANVYLRFRFWDLRTRMLWRLQALL